MTPVGERSPFIKNRRHVGSPYSSPFTKSRRYDADSDAETLADGNWSPLRSAVIVGLIICGASAILIHYRWEACVALMTKGGGSQWMQALIINSILVALTVCCQIGPIFCIILDGFFFGFWIGSLLAFFAELTAYVLCIFLTRTLLKEQVRRWFKEYETMGEVVKVLEADSSGKFLTCFHFVSLPSWLKNYSMGLLSIPWWQAVLVFLPGDAFYASVFAFIGSESHGVADAIQKGDIDKVLNSFSGLHVGILVMSVVCLIFIIVWGWQELRQRRESLAEDTRDERLPLTKQGADLSTSSKV